MNEEEYPNRAAGRRQEAPVGGPGNNIPAMINENPNRGPYQSHENQPPPPPQTLAYGPQYPQSPPPQSPGYGPQYQPPPPPQTPAYGPNQQFPAYPAPRYASSGPYAARAIDPNNPPPQWLNEWNKIPEDQGWSWVFFNLNGRLERKRFIIGSTGLLAVTILLWTSILWLSSITDDYGAVTVFLIGLAITIIFAWPLLALSMKRVRDTGEEPYMAVLFVLAPVLPCIGLTVQILMWIWLCVDEGTKGPNKYGPDPIDRGPLY